MTARILETEAMLANLGAVMEFVDRSCSELGIAGPAAFAVRLAAEEVCANIMSYSYGGETGGPLRVSLERAAEGAVLTIHDRGAPFPPENAPAPDLTSEAEERKVGGLGVYLVRQFMDDVEYSSDPGSGNTMRLVKKLTTEV